MATRWIQAALGGGLLALACGGGDPPTLVEAPGDASETPATLARDTPNRAPVIEEVRLDPEQPQPGVELTAHVTATDPDGDPVEIRYEWRVDGKRMDETGPFLAVGDVRRDALIELKVVARDAANESPPERVAAQVGNSAPRVLAVTLDPPGEVVAGRDLTATPQASDADGDAVEFRYLWSVNGSQLAEDTATLSSGHFGRGDSIELRVLATDGHAESEPHATAPIKVANAAPRITSSPGPLGEDGVFRYAVTVDDPDGDTSFSYRLVAAPSGMDIGPDDGELLWEPGPDAEGNHAVEVEVADFFGGKTTQTFELRLSYASEQTPAAPADPES